MKAFWNWLVELFKVEAVWLDKGQGRWVKSYRLHPGAKICLLLLLGSVAGYVFFMGEPEHSAEDALLKGEEIRQVQRKPESDDVVSEKGVTPQAREEQPATLLIPSSTSRDTTPKMSSRTFGAIEAQEDEYWLHIIKSDYKLYLYKGKQIAKTYDIGVGKNQGNKERRGDNRTPTGSFSIQSIENASSWTHDFRDGNGVIKGAYGPWFIRLKTGWQGIGIHGTHDPDSIGSMVSEGCIRMKNEELEELKKQVFKDMKVVIEE